MYRANQVLNASHLLFTFLFLQRLKILFSKSKNRYPRPQIVSLYKFSIFLRYHLNYTVFPAPVQRKLPRKNYNSASSIGALSRDIEHYTSLEVICGKKGSHSHGMILLNTYASTGSFILKEWVLTNYPIMSQKIVLSMSRSHFRQ